MPSSLSLCAFLLLSICLPLWVVGQQPVDITEGSGTDGDWSEVPPSLQILTDRESPSGEPTEAEEDAMLEAELRKVAGDSNATFNSETLSFKPKTRLPECLPNLDLVFLLDTSGSIEQIYEEHVRWAVALVESLPIEEDTVRVAAVQYAGFPLTEFALGTYPNASDIRQHLEKINFQSGVTRTGYALRKAEAELFRPDRGARTNAAKVIVLFTDGLSIDDPLKPAQQLRDLKGVKIYVVSVGADGFEPEMKRIAGVTGNVFGAADMQRLRDQLISDAEDARACIRIGGHAFAKANKFSSPPLAAASKSVVPLAQPLNLDGPALNETTPEPATAITSEPQVDRIDQMAEDITNNTIAEQHTSAASDDTIAPTEMTTTSLSTTTRETERNIPQHILENGDSDDVFDLSPEERRRTSPTTTQPQRVTTERTTVRRRLTTTQALSSLRPITATAAPTTRRRVTSFDVVPVFHQVFQTATAANRRSLSTTTRTPTTTTRTTTRRTTTTTSARRTTPTGRPFTRRLFTTQTRGPLRNGEECAIDLLLVLDSSGSVQKVYDDQKAFLNATLSGVKIGPKAHRVALLQFAGSQIQKTEWSYDAFENNTSLMHAFGLVRLITGTTYIGAALESTLQILESRRRNVPSMVILLSDGFSQDDATKPAEAIRRLSNVELYALSIPELSNRSYLTALTGAEDKVFVGGESQELKQLIYNRLHCL